MSEKSEKRWIDVMELFRIITPLLITIVIFILTGIKSDMQRIDDKLCKHIENVKIHTEKETTVTRAEYEVQTKFITGQMDRILIALDMIKGKKS